MKFNTRPRASAENVCRRTTIHTHLCSKESFGKNYTGHSGVEYKIIERD